MGRPSTRGVGEHAYRFKRALDEEKLSAMIQMGMLPDTFSLLEELRRGLGWDKLVLRKL